MGNFAAMGGENRAVEQPLLRKSGSVLADYVSVRESPGYSGGWQGAAHWIHVLFAIRGRAKPIFPLACYTLYTCAVVTWLMVRVPGFETLKQLSALSSAVGMIDRWWEGRKLWDSMAAGCSNLGRTSMVWIRDKNLTTRLMQWTMAFAHAAKDQLRHTHDLTVMDGILSPEDMERWRGARSKPKYAMTMVSQCIWEASRSTSLPSGMASNMDQEVRALLTALGSCSRLKHTPIPLAYVIHLRSFLVLWLAALPFIFAPEMHWWAIGVCVVVGYQLLGFEEIGVEIESPFGTDDNDIDLDGLVELICIDLRNKLDWMEANILMPAAV